jgi:hypothetical protein
MKTAIVSAVIMFALACAISMGVAVLIKVLFTAIRRVNRTK